MHCCHTGRQVIPAAQEMVQLTAMILFDNDQALYAQKRINHFLWLHWQQ